MRLWEGWKKPIRRGEKSKRKDEHNTMAGMKGRIRACRVFLVLVLAIGRVGSPANVKAQQATAPQLVIIDTDIGDDIDDAFALALALSSSELKIVGVTTTFGDTELRARLLDRYLRAVGRTDIPVAAGPPSKTDNLLTQRAYALQSPAVKHPDGSAFLLEQIGRHPGQITLIGIGPLVTVQAAIERDPATFRKLKRVVLMGGSIERGYDGKNGEHRPPDAEWNINRDPAGAKALLAAGVPVFMMPLDSTQIHLEEPMRERIFAHGSPLTDQLTLLYHQWMSGTENHSPAPTLFDPVAVAYTFRPDLCPAKPMRIEVDDRGFTRVASGRPNVEVCLESDQEGFLSLLLGRITGARQ
jgi:purine nucleosidase